MSEKATFTKTVWQYSRELEPDTRDFLTGIAEDYAKVKRAVYERFSGIRSLNKLTPVYTVMNAMRYCGLRDQLNLPVVYYELAVIDAVTDIKGMWSLTKLKIREKITENDKFTDDDRKYLRTVLKINSLLSEIVLGNSHAMPDNSKGIDIDVNRLDKWLCSKIRKLRSTPKVSRKDYFRISSNGYRYTDEGICIVSRQPRKRVCIPLRDNQSFDRQIVINIRENMVALAIPVDVKVVAHPDYKNTIYAHIGYKDMITLSNGHVYGEGLGILISNETDRLNRVNATRRKLLYYAKKGKSKGRNIRAYNLGRNKYKVQKARDKGRTETLINTEIGRLLREEKPSKIIITSQVKINKTVFGNPVTNRHQSRRLEGFIRSRLEFKCRKDSIGIIEINSM